MSQTDKDPLAFLDRNWCTSTAFFHDDILHSITEDPRRVRVEPQRLPRIACEELRGLGGSIHRQALNMRLLFRAFLVEVKVDDVRGGHGPVGDAGDDEAK